MFEPGWEHLDDVMIEASVRAGQHAQVERELAELERKAARTGRTWAHAVAARCRGLLASTSEIYEHFRRALEWHDRAPLPLRERAPSSATASASAAPDAVPR